MKAFVILLIGLIALGGCAQPVPADDGTDLRRSGVHVVEVDGVRCVILNIKRGYAGIGGIDCDWKGER